MITWIRQVKTLKELDPLEAFPVDMAISIIKGAIKSAVKVFAESDDGATIVYRNGLNGTEYDCFENYHLPIFAIYKFGYCDPIAMLCYIRNPKSGATSLKVYHRKDIDEEFSEFTTDAFPCVMSEKEWCELERAFYFAFDREDKFDAIWGAVRND